MNCHYVTTATARVAPRWGGSGTSPDAALAETGALSGVVAALQRHAGDRDVCEHGLHTLWNLAAIDRNKVKLAETAAAVPSMLAAMHAHAGDGAVTGWGLRALRHLAAHHASKAQHRLHGAAGVIETALGRGNAPPEALAGGRHALADLGR